MLPRFARSPSGLVALVLTVVCSTAPGADNFERAPMPKGLHRGQLLDTSFKRTVRVLGPEETAPYRRADDDWVVANVLHEGQFWIARIPNGAVRDIFFQKEVFPAVVPAAHTQLRFRFKDGHEAELFPQYEGTTPPDRFLGDLVFSVDAVQVPGDVFDVWRGLWNHFGLALRLVSLKEVYYRSVYGRGHTVEQIRLVLGDEAKQAAFREALRRADRARMDVMYNTVRESCTTNAFGIIDVAIHGAWYFLVPTSAPHVLPVLPRTYLRLRGLISRADLLRNSTPPVNEELAHLADDPTFPARKARDEAQFAAARAAFLAGRCDRALTAPRDTDARETP
jgi:hypothetical protein